jgi:3-keto-disaccharide hydrolase
MLTIWRLVVVPLLPLIALSAPGSFQEDGWIALFDGQSLDGWSAHGGAARFTVEEGAIVGESVPGTDNSFLCTERDFGDFELELEFRVDPALNSGVQVRSEVFPDARRLEVDGKTIELPADRVHGYQVEIDMDPARDRWWSGGLYDEMRRGWLDPAGEQQGPRGAAFTAQGRRLDRGADWNALRIVARGAEIATWLDGEPRARISDSLTPAGLIALQVHGVGDDPSKAGLKVRFRAIRLRPLGEGVPPSAPHNLLSRSELDDGWRLLWDGRTSHGWRGAASEEFPAQGWTMRGGVLTVERGNGGESAGGGDVLTRERFADFELVADFRLSAGANSGIKYFVQPDLRPIDATGAPAATGSAIGCEYQLLDDARHPDAKLGRDGNRTLASLYDLIPAAEGKRPSEIGGWNTAKIVARGTHVEHWLNGAKVVEYERGTEDFRQLVAESKYRNIPGFGEWPQGHLLLQDHGDEVSFRDLKIRVLRP